MCGTRNAVSTLISSVEEEDVGPARIFLQASILAFVPAFDLVATCPELQSVYSFNLLFCDDSFRSPRLFFSCAPLAYRFSGLFLFLSFPKPSLEEPIMDTREDVQSSCEDARVVLDLYKALRRKDKAEHQLAADIELQPRMDPATARAKRLAALREEEEAMWHLDDELRIRRPVLLRQSVFSRIASFYKNVCNLEHKPRKDIYVATVLVQFVCLISIAAGWSAFQPRNAPVEELSANSVPVGYLLSLLAIFLVIVLDRAFYLLRAMKWKLMLHYALVLIVNLFFIFLLPLSTGRSFPRSGALVFFYILFNIYFLLSAEQLRCGYPVFVLGNVLTRNVNSVGIFVYTVYRAIPFLHEIRVC